MKRCRRIEHKDALDPAIFQPSVRLGSLAERHDVFDVRGEPAASQIVDQELQGLRDQLKPVAEHWQVETDQRNNSGVWYDVRICGNAANLRASRARRKSDPPSRLRG